MSGPGQKAKYSLRADVFRFAPNNGHRANKWTNHRGFALSESKRALDAIPASISGWRQSFEYGLSTNARIRSLSAAQAEGFLRFSAGERNPGQGRLT